MGYEVSLSGNSRSPRADSPATRRINVETTGVGVNTRSVPKTARPYK